MLSAELARHYKPNKEACFMVVQRLGLETSQVIMVAAHKGDLHAAHLAGLRTAFVPRPFEYGPDAMVETVSDPEFDLVANDFLNLAGKMST